MEKTLETLSKYPVTTALSLTGTIIVARDIAHAKLLEKIEELTLYMIEIEKRSDHLEQENKALKKEVELLKK